MSSIHDRLLIENDAFMLEQDVQMAKVDAALAERETVEEPFTPKSRPRPEATKKEDAPFNELAKIEIIGAELLERGTLKDVSSTSNAETLTPEERLKKAKGLLKMYKESSNDKAKERIPSLEAEIAELTELIENPPLSEQAIKAGNNILKRGNVLKFLVQQAQRNHRGDTNVIKVLIASISATNSAKSRGIQPDINGPPGGGKSDSAMAVLHLTPKKWRLETSLSAKSLYHHEDLLDGTIIYSDDIEYSKELIATIKRSKGDFQHKQKHTTLDSNRELQSMEMSCRLAWWLSSVESVANDQLKDRDYSLDVDDSAGHAEEVCEYIKESRAEKRIPYVVDWRIEAARHIISQIKEHELFRVVIDCAKAAKWNLTKDHRTQNKFWDLVEAFAILYYQQRAIEQDGWLHATKADFETAKEVFMIRKISHETKLTDAEIKLVQKVATLEDVEGATQAMLVDELGISQQTVSERINSILSTEYLTEERGKHGEKHYHTTSIGLKAAYAKISDIVSLPENYQDPAIDTAYLQPTYSPLTGESTGNKISMSRREGESLPVDSEKSLPSDLGSELSKDGLSLPGSLPNIPVRPVSASGTAKSTPVNSPVVTGKASQHNDQDTCNAKQRHPRIASPLRFLKDCPAFVGADGRTYGPFKADDVANLPAINATGLVGRKVAYFLTDKNDPVRPDLEAEILAGEERAKAKEEHDKTPEPKIKRRLRIQMVVLHGGHRPYERLTVDESTALEWSKRGVCSIEGEA